MLRFRQSLIQVIQELACRVQVSQIDQRIGRASVVRAHDDVVLGARAKQHNPHLYENQRSRQDATGNEGRMPGLS